MATLEAGSSYSFTMDPHAKLTLVVSGKATLSFVSAANNLRSNFTVTDAQSKTYGPYGAIGTMTVTAVDRPVEYTVTPGVPMLSSDGLSLDSTSGPLLVLSAAGLAAPLIVGHDNQTYTRNSANTAADNTFATLASFTLPAGCMGPNGTLIFECETQTTGGTTAMGLQLYIGATAISVEIAWTAVTYDNRTLYFFNTAAAANKYRGSTVRQGNSATGFTSTTINTAVSNTVDIKCRWAGACSAHSIVLHSYRAVVEFGA